MLEDKNTYITETGALMSAYDYSFLSAAQKERCKVYKMEHAKEDKPNFESTLDQYILANIGLSLNSPDLTPMDKGECNCYRLHRRNLLRTLDWMVKSEIF